MAVIRIIQRISHMPTQDRIPITTAVMILKALPQWSGGYPRATRGPLPLPEPVFACLEHEIDTGLLQPRRRVTTGTKKFGERAFPTKAFKLAK